MKQLGRILFCTLLVSAVFVACEEDPDEDIDFRDEYLGSWNANETTGWNAPQFYTVEITRGTSSNDIVIEGLYNNADVEILATVNGFQMSIPTQTSNDIEFSGSGQANADFDQITINFTANDGSGNDEVKAVLTPL